MVTKETYIGEFLEFHPKVLLHDVAEAFETGQKNPSDETIEKICRLYKIWSDKNNSPKEFIKHHWDDICDTSN